jgi:hypothetical protein
VNIDINNAHKVSKLLLVLAVAATGACASRPYQPADMKTFVPNCSQARAQTDLLSMRIEQYEQHHRTHPPTKLDREYYGELKNNLWSLRSSCLAK